MRFLKKVGEEGECGAGVGGEKTELPALTNNKKPPLPFFSNSVI